MSVRIEYLYRYPIKGLTGEAMEWAEVEEGKCIPWDRAFALAQAAGHCVKTVDQMKVAHDYITICFYLIIRQGRSRSLLP